MSRSPAALVARATVAWRRAPWHRPDWETHNTNVHVGALRSCAGERMGGGREEWNGAQRWWMSAALYSAQSARHGRRGTHLWRVKGEQPQKPTYTCPIPFGHVPLAQMFTASQLCPSPDDPPPPLYTSVIVKRELNSIAKDLLPK